MRAQVVVVAGPSGSGKSRLADRTGWPALRLDDFYRSGDDPHLPRLPGGAVDWDDPGSWLHDEAVAAVETLCRDGAAVVPRYDIARNGRVGDHEVRLGADERLFLAEGIFAQEIVADCRERGLLADAICLTQPAVVTFWRRLVRDLREHRKPPHVLVGRGLRLARQQREVVAHAVARGCTPVPASRAYARLVGLVG